MTDIQRVPTPEITRAVDLFEKAIGAFLDTFNPLAQTMGIYEAQVESHFLAALAIRNIEGIFQLARADLVLLPPALVLARSAFEISVRALWLINPPDPFAGEARWVAHLRGELHFYDRLERKNSRVALDPSILESRSVLEDFVESVAARLPGEYKPPTRVPNFETLLDELGVVSAYPMYSILSQYTHGTHYATWLYRRNLGTKKVVGEFTQPQQWHIPLSASWWAFDAISTRLLEVVHGAPPRDSAQSFTVQEAIAAVGNARD